MPKVKVKVLPLEAWMKLHRGFMPKVKVKVLPLEAWMKLHARGLSVEDDGVCPITPIFNRDGYYLSCGRVWFEIGGLAYEVEEGEPSFKYSLEILNHKYLRGVELEAIELLMKAGLASDKQIRLRRLQGQLADFRDASLRELRFRKLILGEIQ